LANDSPGINGGIMVLKALCTHWWIIGEYSVGQCKKCGAIKDFEKLRQDEQTHKTFHRGKTKTPATVVLP
jgi:hypothetical protein